MKKVLIFSLAYYPSFVSGAEAAIKEVTGRIESNDIEFHLITLLFEKNAPKYERIGNTHVHRIGFGGGYLSKIFFIPLAALEAKKLDIVHHFDALWSMMTYMLLPVVCSRMLLIHAPHILTLQDGDTYEKVFKRWFILPITPLLDYGFRSAKVVQAISNYLGTWPARRGYRGVVEIIHNGANPNDLHQLFSRERVTEIQKQYRKKKDDVWLVNTARLVHQKAYDDVIRAVSLLPERVKFLVVGAGNELSMLHELTEKLQLQERVFFVGSVDRGDVTNYRKAGDIFVCPSRSEGLGNAFLSAMASCLPVIATREGGLADFIYDEKHTPDEKQTAWVVEHDSPEQIAEKVKEIIAHPEKVKTVTDTARAMVLEKYDWDKIATQMRERVFAKLF